MIVLAESNLVLELAFQQEQSGEAEGLVTLAEARQVELVIPACAFTEPYQTLIRRLRERKQLINDIERSFKQLGRSRGLRDLVATSDEVLQTFAKADAAERQGLGQTVRRLIACCRVQVLTDTIIENAYDFESRFELDPHDAVVLASVEAALRERAGGEKLFINKNSRDFVTPKIEDHLDRYGCKLITNFSDAKQIVDRAIQAARARVADRCTTP
jgi:predicted nucleic acid-binding protein